MARKRPVGMRWWSVVVVLAACSNGGGGGDGEGDTTSEATTNVDSTSLTATTTAATMTTVDDTTVGSTSPATESTGDSSGSTSTEPATSSTEDSTGNDPGDPVDCDGTTWACGDGEDNDGDGQTDLMDPECTGPCDDDEGSFQTGLPGDNVDCLQDCFFDGDSGHGNDGCLWDLKCDPANPGAGTMCEYDGGGQQCENSPPSAGEDCIMFCQQYVPPGCDCWGCCTVQTPDGPVDIYLNSGDDCSLDNLAGCESCTSHIDLCGEPCEPEKCDQCFGELEPPKGCDEPSCTGDLPCDQTSDCPTDYFCLLGCCYPPPEG